MKPPPIGDALRQLPSVEEVAASLIYLENRFPRSLVVDQIRKTLEAARAEIRAGKEASAVGPSVLAALEGLERPSLRRVINATGVVLHTNLGRAPLPGNDLLRGYSNLEYDLEAGRRGKRDVHASPLLERLLGHPAILVNNNAAAVYLALHELAEGHEVVVSRGQLVEIGDGFRIPEIMRRAGVVLREVGATNRTHLDDYRQAITERTRLLLIVHPSNFRIVGFAGQPSRGEVVALGRERQIPVYEDLGSGCLVDLRDQGIEEPLVAESLKDGVDLVSFSGDKLLGGPQAGIVAGNPLLVNRLRRNPMFRALRADKMTYQMLEETLRALLLERYEAIPALRMIRQPAQRIRERAEALLARLPGLRGRVIAGESVVGGGSTPDQSLPTFLIALAVADAVRGERALRLGEPPVVARIDHDEILIDLRTVAEDEERGLAEALKRLGAE